jgi:hypothetical protein
MYKKGENIPNFHYASWPWNIPNGCSKFQAAIESTNFFHSKALLNFTKFGVLVSTKHTIWKPCLKIWALLQSVNVNTQWKNDILVAVVLMYKNVDGIMIWIDFIYWFGPGDNNCFKGVNQPPGNLQENSTSITIRKNETITVGGPPPPPDNRR